MNALQVPKNRFLPIVPVLLQQHLPILRWSSVGQSPIKRPYSAINVSAHTLMRGIDVTQCRRIHENGVPRWLRALRIWNSFESQIRGYPGGIIKRLKPRKILQKIGRKKSWGGKDSVVGLKFRVAGKYAHFIFGLCNPMDQLAGSNMISDNLKQTTRNPTVAFGPCQRALLLLFTRSEVVNTRPGRRVFGQRAIIIPAGVIHVPL